GRFFGSICAYGGIVLAISGVHDFFVGPRATELLEKNPNDPRADRMRKAASRFGRANLLLGLAVVALAVGLVRGIGW
ncbi:MAG: hypothetical protein ACOCUS_02565, partial [Polyangiales bacterium]